MRMFLHQHLHLHQQQHPSFSSSIFPNYSLRLCLLESPASRRGYGWWDSKWGGCSRGERGVCVYVCVVSYHRHSDSETKKKREPSPSPPASLSPLAQPPQQQPVCSPSLCPHTAEPQHHSTHTLTITHTHTLTSQLPLSTAGTTSSTKSSSLSSEESRRKTSHIVTDRRAEHSPGWEDEDECVQCSGASPPPSRTDRTELHAAPASRPAAAAPVQRERHLQQHRGRPLCLPAGPGHPGPGRAHPDPGHTSPGPLRGQTLPERRVLPGAAVRRQAGGHLGVRLYVQPGLHRTQLWGRNMSKCQCVRIRHREEG